MCTPTKGTWEACIQGGIYHPGYREGIPGYVHLSSWALRGVLASFLLVFREVLSLFLLVLGGFKPVFTVFTPFGKKYTLFFTPFGKKYTRFTLLVPSRVVYTHQGAS